MKELKVGQKIYVKVDNFFEPFYKNRTVTVFYEWCTRTIKKLFKTEFYTDEAMTPPARWFVNGTNWDTPSRVVVYTKEELIEDLKKQKVRKAKELSDRDLALFNEATEQLKKVTDAVNNRSNYYWKDYKEKCKTLELLEKELKG